MAETFQSSYNPYNEKMNESFIPKHKCFQRMHIVAGQLLNVDNSDLNP